MPKRDGGLESFLTIRRGQERRLAVAAARAMADVRELQRRCVELDAQRHVRASDLPGACPGVTRTAGASASARRHIELLDRRHAETARSVMGATEAACELTAALRGVVRERASLDVLLRRRRTRRSRAALRRDERERDDAAAWRA